MTSCAESPAGDLAADLAVAADKLIAAALDAARHGDPHRWRDLAAMYETALVGLQVRVDFAHEAKAAAVRVLGVVDGEARLEVASFHVGRATVS